MRLISALFLAATVGLAPHAHAQSVQRIAAVVNDEVVSVRDLRDRVRLVLFLSGIGDTSESRGRIANQVLRTVVDERLQLQEAKKRGVSVSDGEVGQAIAEMERANRMAPGGLSSVMAQNRVSLNSLRAQFRARIAWSKLVGRRLAPRVDIGDEEVTAALARIEASRGEEAYRLGEILLPVNRSDDEATVRNAAERLVAQIRKGARFGALARQFSRTATAAVGGDRGRGSGAGRGAGPDPDGLGLPHSHADGTARCRRRHGRGRARSAADLHSAGGQGEARAGRGAPRTGGVGGPCDRRLRGSRRRHGSPRCGRAT